MLELELNLITQSVRLYVGILLHPLDVQLQAIILQHQIVSSLRHQTLNYMTYMRLIEPDLFVKEFTLQTLHVEPIYICVYTS